MKAIHISMLRQGCVLTKAFSRVDVPVSKCASAENRYGILMRSNFLVAEVFKAMAPSVVEYTDPGLGANW